MLSPVHPVTVSSEVILFVCLQFVFPLEGEFREMRPPGHSSLLCPQGVGVQEVSIGGK